MKENKSKLWLLVRCALLAVAFVQGLLFMSAMSGDFSKPNMAFFLKMTLLVGAAVFVVTLFQLKGAYSKVLWSRPSWTTSLLFKGQPLIVFDFSAYFFLAMGVGCFFAGFSDDRLRWMWELPVAVGLGAFIGVQIFIWTFKNSMN